MEVDSAVGYLLIALLNLMLGVAVGWLVRRASEPKPDSQPAAEQVVLMKAVRGLSSHVSALVQLKEEITKLTDCHVPPTGRLMRDVIEQLLDLIGRIEKSASEVSQTTIDAYFATVSEFDVADLAGQAWFPAKQSTLDDRRKTRRFPYRRTQRIAPYWGLALPSPSDFYEVVFSDLSTGGFTFVSPDRLRCSELIARLGTEPSVVLVLARIVRQMEYEDKFLVGCEIIRRLDTDASDEQTDEDRNALIALS
jgi:hypothetical protein